MKKYFILLTCVTCTFFLSAQENYKLLMSKIQIAGTSTLHDWTADVVKYDGTATLNFTNKTLTGIKSLTLKMDAGTLKSKKGSTMDKNMYKALKTDQYPSITFTLTKVAPVSGNKVNAEGELTIAGTSHTITILASSIYDANGQWIFTGSKTLKMTDYNVEPPVVLFGTLKTGNEITITFETTFASMDGLTQK
ncbi:MAG TPA: YceI family protein [Saprospiraceae bacterium]|nr:YceI family protein [Saprospiraceae bacterium]